MRFTYARFAERVNRLANALAAIGVQKGDRVAASPNSHQSGVLLRRDRDRAVLVPLNYRLVADDFIYIINHAGASVFIADRN
jgi:fatty-acyl-CoA synthase